MNTPPVISLNRPLPPGQHRLALWVAYDGSPFMGWQEQPHGPSVQQTLEQAFSTACRQPVRVFGSGRTDTGVHALGQVAHVDVPAHMPLPKLFASVNALAAPHIVVRNMLPVGASFHARHSAVAKTYRYYLHTHPHPPLFSRHRSWWLRHPLNSQAMQQAAQHLLGTHDFSAFRAAGCAAKSPIREMQRIAVAPVPLAQQEIGNLTIEMQATGFLQYMARNVVGMLVEVGRGRLAPEDMPRVLSGEWHPSRAVTAPGKGLHKVQVFFDLEVFPELKTLYTPFPLPEYEPEGVANSREDQP